MPDVNDIKKNTGSLPGIKADRDSVTGIAPPPLWLSGTTTVRDAVETLPSPSVTLRLIV